MDFQGELFSDHTDALEDLEFSEDCLEILDISEYNLACEVLSYYEARSYELLGELESLRKRVSEQLRNLDKRSYR